MRKLLASVIAILALFGGRTTPAQAADDLLVDLSKSLVEISTSFAGSDLLLFGAIDAPGDIVVVVRGPARQEVVRRKDQILGVWVNRASLVFGNVPSFYAVAATKPLDQLLTPSLRAVHQIGEENLIVVPHTEEATAQEISGFRQALFRAKENQGLFIRNVGTVRLLGNRLFRTEIAFPETVSTGSYEIDIYLVRDRQVLRKQTVSLTVRKAGVEGRISDFARRQSFAYGLLAVLLAVMAGWAANFAFRRS
jgi:uncharacterized protein (TIGR02186 family)